MTTFRASVAKKITEQLISAPIAEQILQFYDSYRAALANDLRFLQLEPLFFQFLDFIQNQCQSPYPFNVYHKAEITPFNFYQFGLDIIRPLIQMEKSKILGESNLEQLLSQIQAKENVILFGNHQIEPDPQAISLLIEQKSPQLAFNMIFIAGHRVTTDPLAVPFSRGRNLICIYSKRYVEIPPELKKEKLLHNQKAMHKIVQLLEEGGNCIYLAPSGGRDRKNEQGQIEVAPFDPDSTEMFLLLSKKTERKTHFYPLSLYTYPLLPPPQTIKKTLGESRYTTTTPIHLYIGNEIDMHSFHGKDRKEIRIQRSNFIWEQVKENFKLLENI